MHWDPSHTSVPFPPGAWSSPVLLEPGPRRLIPRPQRIAGQLTSSGFPYPPWGHPALGRDHHFMLGPRRVQGKDEGRGEGWPRTYRRSAAPMRDHCGYRGNHSG